jgi:hypothetical protein
MAGIRKPEPAEAPKAYVLTVGMNYPSAVSDTEVRAEEGDTVTDLPAHAIKGLLDAGYIVPKEG